MVVRGSDIKMKNASDRAVKINRPGFNWLRLPATILQSG
jgi:hypothetical protein